MKNTSKQSRALVLSLISSFLVSSSYAANQSQTLLRYENSGLVQTLPAVTANPYKIYTPGFKEPFVIENAALLYDKRNPLPAMLSQGANFAFFEGGVMATVDEGGSFYYKGKTNFQPATLGGVYFTQKGTGEIITIDSAGFYNSTGKIAPAIRLAGGNFFIDQNGVLTTIKHMGTAPGNPLGQVTVKENWNFSDAIRAGGNWFEKVDGSIITIDSETGFFSDHAYMPDARPAKVGGNYFIGKDGYLYTISSKGVLKKRMPVLGEIEEFGYSYMIADDGYFIFVDGEGVAHTQLVRVSTTGIKAEIFQKFSVARDTHQTFIPVNQSEE